MDVKWKILIAILLIGGIIMALNFAGVTNSLFDNSRNADEGIGSNSSRKFGFGTRDNAAGVDFRLIDFTLGGGVFNVLDLSAIVPQDANAVVIFISIRDPSANKFLRFRKKGYLTGNPQSEIITQVSNQWIGGSMTLPCTNGQIEYLASSTLTGADMRIIGWFGSSEIKSTQ